MARIKRLFTNDGNTIRNTDADQVRIPERLCSDGGHIFSDGDADQVSTGEECTLANAGHAVFDHDLLDVRAIGSPMRIIPRKIPHLSCAGNGQQSICRQCPGQIIAALTAKRPIDITAVADTILIGVPRRRDLCRFDSSACSADVVLAAGFGTSRCLIRDPLPEVMAKGRDPLGFRCAAGRADAFLAAGFGASGLQVNGPIT